MNVTQVRYLNTPASLTDQGYVLSVWTDNKVRCTNTRTGKIVRTFRNHQEALEWAAEVSR